MTSGKQLLLALGVLIGAILLMFTVTELRLHQQRRRLRRGHKDRTYSTHALGTSRLLKDILQQAGTTTVIWSAMYDRVQLPKIPPIGEILDRVTGLTGRLSGDVLLSVDRAFLFRRRGVTPDPGVHIRSSSPSCCWWAVLSLGPDTRVQESAVTDGTLVCVWSDAVQVSGAAFAIMDLRRTEVPLFS